ncbi:LCP family protein [Cohnella sp. GCM10027633]|uniref:LCP family glycopolymer transferase n=1 Tax=unclassified Cohnella TaxID=2636738 RepID=UPI00362C1429
MTRKKLLKIALYSILSILVLAMIGGGYLWYSVKHTIDAMYEPLPEKAWTQPVFEQERIETDEGAEVADAAGVSDAPEPAATAVGGGVPAAEVTVLGQSADSEPKDNREADADYRDAVSGSSVKLDAGLVERLLHPDLSNQEPFCILLLGVDERAGDRGRSDTMILLSVQPAKKSVLALSIPRDTRVLIPEREYYDKINHSYAFGGTSLAVAAVERLFGVPIAYYMKTNMEGMIDIVETVGGVDVNNPFTFKYEGHVFSEGELHLNGYEALSFVRMRYDDPHGDFGRTQRQRNVLSSLVDKVASFRTIGKLPHILSQLSKDVRTNLTSGDMLDLASDYRSSIENIETLYLNGKGKTINGIYYYTVRPEDRKAIHNRIIAHLQAS